MATATFRMVRPPEPPRLENKLKTVTNYTDTQYWDWGRFGLVVSKPVPSSRTLF